MRTTERVTGYRSIATLLAGICAVSFYAAEVQAAQPQAQKSRPAATAQARTAQAGTAQAGTARVATRPVAARPAAVHINVPQAAAARGGVVRGATVRLDAARGLAPKASLRMAGMPTKAGLARGKMLYAYAGVPTTKSGRIKNAKHRMAAVEWGGISCVPFARAATGMAVKGNAHAWWDAAAGTYERGARPEAGSVLNFQSTQRMRLGHVAVVARVIDPRTIEIDHANWAGPGARKGSVSRGVPVIDVSARNDWSAVQVGLGHTGGFGSVYPTYGFIYDRPDRGVMVANTMARPQARYSEVAHAPQSRPTPAGRLGWGSQVLPTSTIDAPIRSLR